MARTHLLQQLETVLLVGIGGFAGANLRYFVELAVPDTLAATLTVNMLGCFALGFILYATLYAGTISKPGRTVLTTGFISSFTTYSTFIVDAVSTTPVVALGYVTVSYALGFGAVLVGRAGARRVTADGDRAMGVGE